MQSTRRTRSAGTSENLRCRSQQVAGQEAFRQITGIHEDEYIVSSSDHEDSESILSEIDDDEAPNEITSDDWNIVDTDSDTRFSDAPTFTGATGLNPEMREPNQIEEHLSFFLELCFPHSIFETLTKWTNTRMWCSYVEQSDEDSLRNSKLFIEVNEMKFFLVLSFLWPSTRNQKSTTTGVKMLYISKTFLVAENLCQETDSNTYCDFSDSRIMTILMITIRSQKSGHF